MVEFQYLGQNIKRYRQKANLSQEKLAEMCECCGSFIGKIENGKSLPSLDMLSKIAASLGVSAEQLLLEAPCKQKNRYVQELEERINRLPAATQIEACESLSNVLSIIEGLHK